VMHLFAEGAIQRSEHNQWPHGCSSSPQKMQYAVQIDCIWSDLFQPLEETRDAVNSSIPVDGETAPAFAGLDTCDNHMTKKWRGTAAPAGAGRAQVNEAKRKARPN